MTEPDQSVHLMEPNMLGILYYYSTESESDSCIELCMLYYVALM